MNTVKLSLCVLLIVTSFVGEAAAQVRVRGRGTAGLLLRNQNFQFRLQNKQEKQLQENQKAFQEWKVKADAEAARKLAEHRADLARKKDLAEKERLLRIEKNKQHNAGLKSHEKPASKSDKSDEVENDMADE